MPVANILISYRASLGNLISAAQQITRSFGSVAGALGAASAKMSDFSRIASGLTSTLSGSNRNFGQHRNQLEIVASSYRGLVGQVINLNRFLNATFSAIRQIGQGLQNFGMVFSLYFSLPMTTWLKNTTSNLLDFDDALVEVRKTAGLSLSDLDKLGRALTKISAMSPTPRVDLAKIAADWGRMGVRDLADLTGLTEVTDKLVVATTLQAEEVVTVMGRIANIYYDSYDRFVKDFEKLGSMINELGQQNPVTESEIISAAFRSAAAARTLNIPITDFFGMVTSAVSVGASPERSGTQLASALFMISKNMDRVASSLGVTKEAARALMDQNPVEFILALAEKINSVESETQRVALATNLWGTVGAKTMLALGQNADLVRRNIALANFEFDRGISLQLEFERAMDGVKNQLSLLRNNFTYLAAVIGESILPTITKIVLFMVPGVQIITSFFDSISDGSKLAVIGIGLLLAALGPLIIMIGTFMFSLGIIGTGISTFIAAIMNAVLGVGRFAAGLLFLGKPLLIVLGIIGVLAYALYRFGDQLGWIRDKIMEIVSNAYSWGSNLFYSFASGMMSAISYVYDTIMFIINSFIGLIQSFSPPREGPLKDVDIWGENLINTWAAGMQRAAPMTVDTARGLAMKVADALRTPIYAMSSDNLELFNTILGPVRSIINAVGSYFDSEDGFSVSEWIGKAAEALVDFVNSGSGLSGLASILGGFVSDFERLLGLQNAYNQSVANLERLTNALKNVDKELERQIESIARRTDISISQRAALIRSARIDAINRKKSLQEQKEAAEEEKRIAQDSLNNQKQIINTLVSLVQASEEKGKKVKTDEFAGILADSGVLGEDDTISRFKSELRDTSEETGLFFSRLSKSKEALEGFIAGLRGISFPQSTIQEMSQFFRDGYARGLEINERIGELVGKINSYRESISGIGSSFKDSFASIGSLFFSSFKGAFLGGAFDSSAIRNLSLFEKTVYSIGHALGFAARLFDMFVSHMVGFFTLARGPGNTILQAVGNSLKTISAIIYNSFASNNKFLGQMRDFFGPLMALFNSLLLLFEFFIRTVAEFLPHVILAIMPPIMFVIDLFLSAYHFLGGVLEFINGIFGLGDFNKAVDYLANSVPWVEKFRSAIVSLGDVLKEKLPPALGGFVNFISAVVGTIALLWIGLVNIVRGVGFVLGWIFEQLANLVASSVTDIFEEQMSYILEFVGKVLDVANMIFNLLAGTLFGIQELFNIPGAREKRIESMREADRIANENPTVSFDAFKTSMRLALGGASSGAPFMASYDVGMQLKKELSNSLSDVPEVINSTVQEKVEEANISAAIESIFSKELEKAKPSVGKTFADFGEFISSQTAVSIGDYWRSGDAQKEIAAIEEVFSGISMAVKPKLEDAGNAFGQSITSSLSDTLRSNATSTTTAASIIEAIKVSETALLGPVSNFGAQLGSITGESYAKYWMSDDAMKEVGAIKNTVDQWAINNVDNLKNVGVSIATFIVEGFTGKISLDRAGMDAVTQAMNSWLDTRENINRYRRAGFMLGVEFAKWVGEAILRSRQYIATAIWQMIVNNMKPEELERIKNLLPVFPENIGGPASGGGSGGSTFPSGNVVPSYTDDRVVHSAYDVLSNTILAGLKGDSVLQPAYISNVSSSDQFIFNITIDKETIHDREKANAFAGMLRQTLEREMRYGRLR